MRKGAVAAPRPLQALVYPILRRMSLPFCEKIVDFSKVFTNQRAKAEHRCRRSGAGPEKNDG